MGFKYSLVQKGVYFNGHEREDVVDHRQKEFLPRWKDIERRFVVWDEEEN